MSAESLQKAWQESFHPGMGRHLSGNQTGCETVVFKRLQEPFVAANDMNRNRPGAIRAGDLYIGLVIAHNNNQRIIFKVLLDKAFEHG